MPGDAQVAAIIRRFAGARVLVVGDVMLDEYVWGDVQRISPEAPVPVVHITRRTYGCGGAANVAVNVVGLGGRVLLCGVVGDDLQAGLLRAALRERGVDADGLIVDTGRPTTTKTRIIAHSQQMVRVDAEMCGMLDGEREDEALAWVCQHLGAVDACILSDYGKGVMSPRLAGRVIDLMRRAGKPVVVDPKGIDYTRYRGATVVTPNTHEAAQATGCAITNDEDLLAAGNHLTALLKGSALLITRGAQGMSLFCDGADPVHIPTVAHTVFDVTGAGDTVVSTLALALTAGVALEDAAHLANRAAGIVVGKVGAATVTPDELLARPIAA